MNKISIVCLSIATFMLCINAIALCRIVNNISKRLDLVAKCVHKLILIESMNETNKAEKGEQ